jgi:hypothetical protein
MAEHETLCNCQNRKADKAERQMAVVAIKFFSIGAGHG